jgi:hypothetical protein
MNASSKFAGFALGLAAVFGIALAVGATLGPEPTQPTAHDAMAHEEGPAAKGGPRPGEVTEQPTTGEQQVVHAAEPA